MVKNIKKNRQLLFQIGLGGIFLANSVAAWAAPSDFRDLIDSNGLLSHVGHSDLLVKLIGVNDVALFLAILMGQYRKLVAIWGCLWLVGVIYVTGFWTTDTIEHVGVIALLVYYSKLKV